MPSSLPPGTSVFWRTWLQCRGENWPPWRGHTRLTWVCLKIGDLEWTSDSLESAKCLNQFFPEIGELCQTMVYLEFESKFRGSWFKSFKSFKSSMSGNIPYFFYRRFWRLRSVCHATLLLSGQDEEWLWVGSIFEKLGPTGAWNLDFSDDHWGNPGYCLKIMLPFFHQEWGCRPAKMLNLERKLIKEVLEWYICIFAFLQVIYFRDYRWIGVQPWTSLTCLPPKREARAKLQRNGKTQQGWCPWANFHYRLIST